MIAPAIFGIDNNALNTAINVLLLILFAVWLALVWWTYTDARRRIDDSLLVICATVASLIFPFVGTIVYLIVRPPEYLDDVHLRELEMYAAEARLRELDHHVCSHCGHSVRSDYLRCPNCERRLKQACHSCARPLEPDWKVCPYCEAEVRATASSAPPATPAGRRRRRPTSAEYPAAAD